MVSDPLGDLLIQIKNAALVRRKTVTLPYSKMKMAVVQVLVGEGYLKKATKVGQIPNIQLQLELAYQGKTSAVTNVRRISKPGMRSYVRSHEIPLVVGGMGTAIVSTPSGVMTGKMAKQKGIGGELLCEIW